MLFRSFKDSVERVKKSLLEYLSNETLAIMLSDLFFIFAFLEKVKNYLVILLAQCLASSLAHTLDCLKCI